MSERKYTDEEIINTLCHHADTTARCESCLYTNHGGGCSLLLAKDAFDLINRQMAEIERLKAEQMMAEGYADALEERAKVEAIKAFAERLHKGIDDFRDKREMVMLPYTESALLIIERKIDNLVAEMTEGK